MAHKIGIIGYGYMAEWHHKNSARIDGLTVTSAYDIDESRLAVAEEKGLKAYKKLEDFLADGDFDIVLVATPNNFHKEMTIKALESGRHVVCEKPAVMTAGDFDDMCVAAEKAGKIFTVHQNRRWDKDFNIVKKALEENFIGKPFTIESRVHGQKGVVFGWRAHKVAGGGMVLDWGVHLIDQILWMVKENVKEVYANLHNVKTPEVDDYFKAVLRFESGLSAQIEVGTYNLAVLPRWYVCGDLGSVVVEGWDCKGRIIRAKQTAVEWEPEVVQTAAGPTRTMAPRPKETLDEIPLPEVSVDWADFYRNFIAVIEGREESLIKHSEVRRVIAVMEAIFKSHETGESVKL